MTAPCESPTPSRRRATAAGAVALALAAGSAAAASTPFDTALSVAAEAARREGFDAARRHLGPWVDAPAPAAEATTATTVLGLLAFDAGRFESATLLLEREAPRELDDWRLWALAETNAATQRPAEAQRALDALIARHPASPLVPRAVVRRVELALFAGDHADAARRLADARPLPLPRSERVALELAAWRLASAGSELPPLVEAARQLLVVAPLEASKLRVVDTVAARRAAGSDWRLWLSPAELVRRADALLSVELPAGALTTLAAVPPERRDLAWHLLEARALTAAERGVEAYATLLGPFPVTASERAALEWERARAAAEAIVPRRGRALAADAAERYRRLSREHLLAVVRHDPGGDLAASALELLASQRLDEARLDEAVAALRQLVALRPLTTVGARRLWEIGWTAYERGDRERALATWRELTALFPRSTSARAGRYWTARVLEQRGDAAGARRIYLELLATDIADFYARQSGLRLAGSSQTPAGTPPVRDRWPESPALERAARLSALGLDRLARHEIELVGAAAEPRAAAALEALVLARLGERRSSLHALRRAFPDLGTAQQASVPREAVALYYPIDFRDTVVHAAARERLPTSLVFGMVHQESAFDAAARSSSGARGLMQLMPSTGREVAQRLGLPFSSSRLDDPQLSLRLGTHYFRQLLDRFDGRVELALAGYNGGPGRISRLWRAAGPDPELDRFLEGLTVTESRNYVKRILVLADSYRSLYPDLG